MQVVAGWSKSAGHREKSDLPAFENVIRGLPNGTFGGHDAEFYFGQSVADLDGHRYPLSRYGRVFFLVRANYALAAN
jgi:hypothetical protein